MRTALRIVFVAALAFGAIALAAVPGGAGAPITNTVTIEKEVIGTPPAGTTFTVQVDCVNGLGAGAAAAPTVTFDENGDPTTPGANVFHPGPTSTCTVTETGAGGASSVGYGCVSQGNVNSDPDGSLVDCTSDNVVHFTDVIGDSATITVTNTFVPTPVPPPPTPAPLAVQAAPTFTG